MQLTSLKAQDCVLADLVEICGFAFLFDLSGLRRTGFLRPERSGSVSVF